MKFRVFLSTCCVIVFLIGCTKKPSGLPATEATIADSETTRPFELEPAVKTEVKKKPLFSKDLKEALYFAASLERESLRLIAKNNALEATTLFSVLSYAFEIASGTKRSPPRNIDCGRFQIEASAKFELKVFKVCQKPSTLVATIQLGLNEQDFKVVFKTKEWSSVVGLSVTLTNPDIECEFQLKEKKLNSLNCQNWAYVMSSSDAAATEIHLKTMAFSRGEKQQLKLQGGFYRDLIERKKIEVSVPLLGKIKLIEKEIEVKDDFIEKPKLSEESHGEKSKEKEKNDDYQKWIQSGQGPPGSGARSTGAGSQTQSEDQNQSAKEGWPAAGSGAAGSGAAGSGAAGPGEEQNPQPQIEPNAPQPFEAPVEGPTSGGVPPAPAPQQPNRGR